MSKNSIKIPVKKHNSTNDIPKMSYDGDAGFDLKSNEDTCILPGERKLIKCGFCMSIPKGYAGLVIPRSGLALKHGITVLNSPGLIDSGYRGEICVVLLNTDSKEKFDISIGDRIAQLMIVECPKIVLDETLSLDESNRAEKGFGSSGVK